MEGRIHIEVPQWLIYQMIISQQMECLRYCIIFPFIFWGICVACYFYQNGIFIGMRINLKGKIVYINIFLILINNFI